MTKILSDIVSNAPEGIELEMIRVNQSDSTFSVSGTALEKHGLMPTEIIAQMQRNLAQSLIFDEVKQSFSEPNAYNAYPFELSAKITLPHRSPPYELARDFDRWPLVDRQGNRPPRDETGAKPEIVVASETKQPPAPRPESTDDVEESPVTVDPGPRSPITNGIRRPGAGPGDDRGDPSQRTGGVDPTAYPEPLSEAQINAMSEAELRQHWIEVSAAHKRARSAGPPEEAERLKKEFDLILARLREMRSGGPE
jgi:hypothetical protein